MQITTAVVFRNGGLLKVKVAYFSDESKPVNPNVFPQVLYLLIRTDQINVSFNKYSWLCRSDADADG